MSVLLILFKIVFYLFSFIIDYIRGLASNKKNKSNAIQQHQNRLSKCIDILNLKHVFNFLRLEDPGPWTLLSVSAL